MKMKLDKEYKSLPTNIQAAQIEEGKILFSFDSLKPISYIKEKRSNFFIKYLERLKKLSELDWKTIQSSARHSFGFEIIDRSCMTKLALNNIPDDLQKLMCFRATGDNHVFLGTREEDVFHVLFIESQFGDIYSHDGKKKR